MCVFIFSKTCVFNILRYLMKGVIWKLNKIVKAIRMARECFDKTWEEGIRMFPGNLLMHDLRQQYRSVLLDSQSDENDGSKNKEGTEPSNNDPFESPAFTMGPQTQLEVFTASDKACEDFYADKNLHEMDAPSFSIGLTQDPLWATQKDAEGSGSIKEQGDKVAVEATEKGKNGMGSNMNVGKAIATENRVKAVSAVPLSVVKPDEGRVKRRVTKTNTVVSPFYNRVIGIDNALTNEEKQMDLYLIKKNVGDLR